MEAMVPQQVYIWEKYILSKWQWIYNNTYFILHSIFMKLPSFKKTTSITRLQTSKQLAWTPTIYKYTLFLTKIYQMRCREVFTTTLCSNEHAAARPQIGTVKTPLWPSTLQYDCYYMLTVLQKYEWRNLPFPMMMDVVLLSKSSPTASSAEHRICRALERFV
jgi:hypothetical protein